MLSSSSMDVTDALASNQRFVIFCGDCRDLLRQLPDASVDLIVSSPPYFMGKEYDRSANYEDFEAEHHELAPLLVRVLRPGGSLCWQVGIHARKGSIIPLDYLAYHAFSKDKSLILRNRIVWHFEHGVHSRQRFSGRHETILWFTKGENYAFNLDAVRVPQKYPGKRHYKGPQKGEISGNPAGKNPSDVWIIPNVKAKHQEKTAHPCQFPIAIPQRLIRALTKPNDLVFDPFAGVSSTGIASAIENRRYIGCETDKRYAQIGLTRYRAFTTGDLPVREWDRPVEAPNPRQAVAQAPAHFWSSIDGAKGSLPERKESRKGLRP